MPTTATFQIFHIWSTPLFVYLPKCLKDPKSYLLDYRMVVDMDVDKVAWHDMELDFTDTQLWQLVILEMMLAVMLGVVDMESE